MSFLHLDGFTFIFTATILFMIGLDNLLNPQNMAEVAIALFIIVGAATGFLGGVIILLVATGISNLNKLVKTS